MAELIEPDKPGGHISNEIPHAGIPARVGMGVGVTLLLVGFVSFMWVVISGLNDARSGGIDSEGMVIPFILSTVAMVVGLVVTAAAAEGARRGAGE